MSDDRSRREKLEAVLAPNSGATEGERENARSLLDKMGPEPAQASEPFFIVEGGIARDDGGFDWELIMSALGNNGIRALHDAGVLVSWDERGFCTVCGRRH